MKKVLIFTALLAVMLTSLAAQQKEDALVLYRNGNYARAIQICEQELVTYANSPSRLIDSYCVLCWSLVRNRQYSEAEQRTAEARKINSNDVRLIEIQGEAKFYLGKNSAALELFQNYIAAAPSTAARIGNAYYYMGEIYVRQAKYQHADIAFTASVHTEPTVDYWWTRCGYAREMAGSYQTAIDAYSKALELNPSQGDAARGKERCQSRLR
ncbi:MAG: tetratricopeptide repeat protein [Treponema sp.]|nr:tetratricopeptide repeat protein [Treponema sp.]